MLLKKWSDILTIANGKNQKDVVSPDGQYPIYGSGGVAEISDYRSNSPRFYYTNFVDIIISHERMNSFYLPLYLCGAFPE